MEQYNIISHYFPLLQKKQIAQYKMLYAIYQFYNDKINLISRKDIHNLYIHHVLHSLSIAKIITFLPQTKILDLGTGGGFPGIPLAILFPNVQFHLVDTIQKKMKVVEEIVHQLQLKNITLTCTRGEHIKDTYDFVVGRGVTDLHQFYCWSFPKISKTSHHAIKNGILYLKGGDFYIEVKKLKAKTKVYDLSPFFSEKFFFTKKLVHIF